MGGDIFAVLEYHHVKPGKGAAFARVRVKNIKTGQVIERTFRSSDKLDDVPVDEKRLQNLYRSGDNVHFMDNSTYEEVVVPLETIGEDARFLQENLEVIGISYHNEVLKVVLPTFITAEVTHTEPGFKGDSTRSGTKPATIDTGAIVQVPLFINIGDHLKIDTRTGAYVERVQK
ncbi:MAG: elongation factor P [Omnitrophica WOR_2 bacterium RIFCSPLOWO2_12_FULL_50_9]|nr:MAG: elongation factor P [Omnitrophica WOR_2 bacterium RIFCSPHIGHO2_02_FULL_50_17]OGX41717.1 MAG: elongation factor P [Omnitrophica WOR_2 bacterium RIFCSPLOWO2_12_FULL_50_9]